MEGLSDLKKSGHIEKAFALCRVCLELGILEGHASSDSINAAQSLAANKLADFLSPDCIVFVPLIQQLLIAENCIRKS